MLAAHLTTKRTTVPSTLTNIPLNILILDDSGFDRLRIRREISRSGVAANIDEISCLCHLKDALGRENYDLVVIDYFLPDGTGEEALDILQGHETNHDAIPLIVSGNSWLNEDSIRKHAASVYFLQKGKLGYGKILREITQREKLG